jgi:hypothetical protein
MKQTKIAGREPGKKRSPGKHRATVLLDQQMWCWGRDVVRGEGNLLLQFGFRKERPPAGVSGCTAYVLTLFPGCQLVLWGFGLFFGLVSCGGMFIRRYGFDPVWTDRPALPGIIWCVEGLPPFRPPQSHHERSCTQRLLAATGRWVASYEQWVLDTVGLEYRWSCLRQWHKPIIPAERVPEEWQRIAEERQAGGNGGNGGNGDIQDYSAGQPPSSAFSRLPFRFGDRRSTLQAR